MEINYKCNNSFEVGVLSGGSNKNYKVSVLPKDYWNKIYIELTQVVTSASTPYKVLFKATKNDSINNAEIFLDNIKLIHYK